MRNLMFVLLSLCSLFLFLNIIVVIGFDLILINTIFPLTRSLQYSSFLEYVITSKIGIILDAHDMTQIYIHCWMLLLIYD